MSKITPRQIAELGRHFRRTATPGEVDVRWPEQSHQRFDQLTALMARARNAGMTREEFTSAFLAGVDAPPVEHPSPEHPLPADGYDVAAELEFHQRTAANSSWFIGPVDSDRIDTTVIDELRNHQPSSQEANQP